MGLPKRMWFQGQLYVRVADAPPNDELFNGDLWWNDDEEEYVDPEKAKELYDNLIRASRQLGHKPNPARTAVHKQIVGMGYKVKDYLMVEGFDSIAKHLDGIIFRHYVWSRGADLE